MRFCGSCSAVVVVAVVVSLEIQNQRRRRRSEEKRDHMISAASNEVHFEWKCRASEQPQTEHDERPQIERIDEQKLQR